ncbi:hypothetical protein NL676_000174 [Syzygium grande]|nr:hypothetical protein NL676_000174 [Syzygium grande]
MDHFMEIEERGMTVAMDVDDVNSLEILAKGIPLYLTTSSPTLTSSTPASTDSIPLLLKNRSLSPFALCIFCPSVRSAFLPKKRRNWSVLLGVMDCCLSLSR